MDANNRKFTHWIARGEVRYWARERFNGHFFGAHLLGGRYNISDHNIPFLFDKQYRYEGSAWGAGITYGYNLTFGRRWGAEVNAGVGVMHMGYKRFDCRLCAKNHTALSSLYFGPTRLGITLSYNLK
jgi:hypothetical protein